MFVGYFAGSEEQSVVISRFSKGYWIFVPYSRTRWASLTLTFQPMPPNARGHNAAIFERYSYRARQVIVMEVWSARRRGGSYIEPRICSMP